MIKNPIIAGFYPDPSICRADEDYYIVTSSFSYFPGVPIFHSRDLVNWEQIGHVLDRKEQLPLTYEMMSGGIFAPTIRYHNGIFYMITTNMSMGCVNFIVTAENPAGPWSDMYIIEGADGIDPSLFWDEDGTCYYTGTTRFEDESGLKQGIWCSKIDVTSFKLIGERHIIGAGAQINAESPEGPHLYKKYGYYYMMISEGGTEHFHAITISRSKSVFGPYENYQGNPILTHRHLGKEYPICNIGHGDLVELTDGSWYMVCLGSRLMNGYHKILGRETFILPVEWEDAWPIPSKGSGKVELSYEAPKLPAYEFPKKGCRGAGIFENESVEHFDNELGYEWNYLGTPYEDFIKIEDSCLKIKLLKNSTVPWEFNNIKGNIFDRLENIGKTRECMPLIGRRQQHIQFTAYTKLKFIPKENEAAGITILQNDANQIRIEAALDKNGKTEIRCIKTMSIYDENMCQHFKETIEGRVTDIQGEAPYILKVVGNGTKYSFYAGENENNLREAAINVDASFLGSESAGGFVGAYIALFATGGGAAKEKYAEYDYFIYRGN